MERVRISLFVVWGEGSISLDWDGQCVKGSPLYLEKPGTSLVFATKQDREQNTCQCLTIKNFILSRQAQDDPSLKDNDKCLQWAVLGTVMSCLDTIRIYKGSFFKTLEETKNSLLWTLNRNKHSHQYQIHAVLVAFSQLSASFCYTWWSLSVLLKPTDTLAT